MSDYSGMIQELSDICNSLGKMSVALSPPSFDDKGFVIPHVGSKESHLLSEVRFTLMNVISLLNRRES